ncbi:MAG TPA: PIN domain-containing protein [Gemmatimonadota bacterium]|nr:PIN domain-containing protein [Gemmatimonadota bacterium]
MLAELFAEKRRPPEDLWSGFLVSSRLLTYEVWAKLHSLGLGESLAEEAVSILELLSILELDPPVLARALEPFPRPIRALDAMHLASADFLRRQGQDVQIATYDMRMGEAAHAMGFEIYPLN